MWITIYHVTGNSRILHAKFARKHINTLVDPEHSKTVSIMADGDDVRATPTGKLETWRGLLRERLKAGYGWGRVASARAIQTSRIGSNARGLLWAHGGIRRFPNIPQLI
jgi:hypothetical protein